MAAQAWLNNRDCGMKGKWGFLQWVRPNLENKYCGEVIGDDVQLWTETGDLSETKWQGKNMRRTWKHDENLKHNKEPENKNIKTLNRDTPGFLKDIPKRTLLQ